MVPVAHSPAGHSQGHLDEVMARHDRSAKLLSKKDSWLASKFSTRSEIDGKQQWQKHNKHYSSSSVKRH